jgi:hypothetical protein
LSCLDKESFGSEDQLWKAVIEGVGNYLIVWGLCLCNSVIVNRTGNGTRLPTIGAFLQSFQPAPSAGPARS